MSYDFEATPLRRDTNSLKWSVGADELPMWVADMDLPTAPAILEAVKTKVATGVFGYEVVPEQYALAIQSWWGRRYDLEIDPQWVCFADGVVPAISSLIRTFSEPGDGVLIQTPVYNSFAETIQDCGRTVVTSDLPYSPPKQFTQATSDTPTSPPPGQYGIDFTDLEEKLAKARTVMMLVCNPNNPTGQVWTPEELSRIAEMAHRHGVVVISDEIHCDITEPGVTYTPFATVDPDVIWVTSASKSFNIPGLQGAAVMVRDGELRARVTESLHRDGISQPGSFAAVATIAAYTQCADWLDAMRQHVWANRSYLENYVLEHHLLIHVVPSQSTYLAWIDCSGLTADAGVFAQFLRESTGLVVNPGALYGQEALQFIRMNLACPTLGLTDGIERLTRAIHTMIKGA
jgi:cystathionine beta-lyase